MALIDINDLEAADRISRMSDDVMLTPSEAATYLRVSHRTLERMRASGFNGYGPVYHQAAVPGAVGVNQKIGYRLGDLRNWRNDNTVSSSIEAAVKKGQL